MPLPPYYKAIEKVTWKQVNWFLRFRTWTMTYYLISNNNEARAQAYEIEQNSLQNIRIFSNGL